MKKLLILIISIMCIFSTTSCQKKSTEINLTTENFETFFNIDFYLDEVKEVKTSSSYSYYYSYDYTSNILVDINAKQYPGDFKLSSVQLEVTLESPYGNYPDDPQEWKIETSKYISDSVEYDTDYSNKKSIIKFTTKYIDIPLSGYTNISIPMKNTETSEFPFTVTYKIIGVKGTYVPSANEDVSIYE